MSNTPPSVTSFLKQIQTMTIEGRKQLYEKLMRRDPRIRRFLGALEGIFKLASKMIISLQTEKKRRRKLGKPGRWKFVDDLRDKSVKKPSWKEIKSKMKEQDPKWVQKYNKELGTYVELTAESLKSMYHNSTRESKPKKSER